MKIFNLFGVLVLSILLSCSSDNKSDLTFKNDIDQMAGWIKDPTIMKGEGHSGKYFLKVDSLMPYSFGFNELLSNIKKIINNYDFSNIKNIIDKKLDLLERGSENFFNYRNLQIEKILELQLHRKTKLNLNIFDENFYSYKLIF